MAYVAEGYWVTGYAEGDSAGVVFVTASDSTQANTCSAGAISTGSFSGSISDADIDRIVAAVLVALNATTIPVDMHKTNGVEIIGDGSAAIASAVWAYALP